MIVDTHCHLDFEWFDDDREEVIKRAEAATVTNIIVPALDLDNSRTVLELASQYEGVFGAVGVHPNSSANWDDNWIDAISDLAHHSKCVAIGEIGLDYYHDSSPKLLQHSALEAQLHLAWKRNLPVIIHNRNSDYDLINMLKTSPLAGSDRPGVLHSFLTSWDIAEEALDLGYYIGFTGPITYKNSDSLRQVVKKVPLDRVLVETDAPFLTPQEKRGQRNEPAFVSYIIEELARIKQRPVEEIVAITTGNARALFGPLIGSVA